MADTTKVFNMPLAMMCGIEVEKEISRDGSNYSLSTGILPSLGARSNRRVKLRRFIVSPYDRRYRAWEIFLIVLVVYSAWGSPFEFGFLGHAKGTLALVDNIVNAFFAIDIILTFFLAYLDRTTYLLVDDPKLIARKYLTSCSALMDSSTCSVSSVSEELVHYLQEGYNRSSHGICTKKLASRTLTRTNDLTSHVYLFHGISNDLLFQLVSEMKDEYYPPREDVILQNEAPTDFYILVTGTAVKESFHSRILFFHIT
ncbi:hypothetical protein ZIOFF_056175 [Zingiber officinale]|uniref:Cyclic nucleotide-binding domain-containing protein n=1 Tax=Zingiber officinale TaxID=94328 RepID=A0A8J5FGS8_ZINOF|nr:hypothetical protein ZIOFF_056175 [Zingiber officinale]